jgi:uncharacterized lipoprotein YajG
MKYSILLTALLSALALSGCDRPSSVVEVPGPTVAVPVPAPANPTVVVERHDRDVHEERPAPVIVERPEEHRDEAVKVEHGNTSVTVVNPRDTK